MSKANVLLVESAADVPRRLLNENRLKIFIKKILGLKKKDGFIDISYWALDRIVRVNILKGILYAAPKYARGRLVDIGCGTKPYESIFMNYVDSYFGIDYEASAGVNYKQNTKADLYCDCSDIKLDSDSFDTLLSTQVMEHVFETKKYVSECFRLLKTGGMGIFTIPMSWKLHAEPYDYYRFTRWAIDKLFREVGFDIVELRPLEGAFASLIQLKMVNFSERKSMFSKFTFQLKHKLFSPFLSWLALNLDKYFWNDKLCLNYLLVVRKNRENLE